jgi:Fe-S-cluster-containing dehydrogenase component
LLLWTKALAEDQKALADCDDWHDYLKAQWQSTVLSSAEDAEKAWDDALRQGMVTTAKDANAGQVELNRGAAEGLVAEQKSVTPGDYELLILPHDAIFDGRFASNAWLQELPDPVSKLVWENAASVGPATAERLGVKENDQIVLKVPSIGGGEEQITLPVLVQSGMADGVVVTTLGYGRTQAGHVATGQGVNMAPLLGRCGTPLTPWLSVDVAVAVSGQRATGAARLVRTQKQFSMMDRPISLKGTRAEYRQDPAFVKQLKHVPPLEQLDPPYDYSQGHKWGMAIDQNACTGCSACVIACQAENNIPVVGKEECGRGREMQWIRIDRYEGGDAGNPDIDHQPMLCQQCDNAPCESVCPVNATSHSPEGLNDQTYNRCVGTRYCANNCPYKVRRFNFFAYQGRIVKESVQELVFNPQVTVRSRGVMEKCTFCIQRINEVKFRDQNQEKPLKDGAIQPACAQACPAQAIVFGDVNDPESKIAQRRASSLVYHVLEELNVRPNVAYLARVTNPHSDISAPAEGGHG